MALRQDADSPKARKPVLGVYFEDHEGVQFCDALFPAAKRGVLGRKLGVQIKLIPLCVGGSNLVSLPDKDPMFKNRVLIVDADTPIPQKAEARGNTIKLPCHRGARGTDRSPENVMKIFLRSVISTQNWEPHEALRRFSVVNPSTDKVSNTFFPDSSSASAQREASKGWWVAHWNQLKQWGVIREWAICHAEESAAFVKAFEAAATKTASRII